MNADRVIEYLDTFTLAELHRIRAKLDKVITQVEDWQQPSTMITNTDQPQSDGKHYRQEYTKCNKPNCTRCTAGPGHGPYWYSYWREGNKLKKQYIGKNRP